MYTIYRIRTTRQDLPMRFQPLFTVAAIADLTDTEKDEIILDAARAEGCDTAEIMIRRTT